jgi:replicative DNA helicase
MEQKTEEALPLNLDAERFVLGSILLDDTQYLSVAAILSRGDFALRKHQIIFGVMSELQQRGEKIDRVTVFDALVKKDLADACDGLSYLISLDDGLPRIPNLDAYCRIVLEKANLRRLAYLGQSLLDRACRGEEDSSQIVSEINPRLLEAATDPGQKRLVTAAEIFEAYPGGINALLSGGRRGDGLETGFPRFDQMTSGLHKGELIILAARPSMGKTALAMNIAAFCALKRRKTAAVFSLEMSKESLLTRLLCAQARVDSQRFRGGFLNQAERLRLAAAASEIAAAPLFLDDSAGIALADIHSRLRRLKLANALDLVVIDYLQLMSLPGRSENRNAELGALTRGLKLMAKDLDVPLIVLSQLSRAVETRVGDHRPILSDLRESGNIEQDADLVVFIFRPEIYKPERADLRGKAELITAKQRNGPTGTVKVVFLRDFTLFANPTSELDEAPPPETDEPVADEVLM